jgi:hypothetical protein
MDPTMIDPEVVLTSAQSTKRTSAKPPLRSAVKKAKPKKVRADGTVKTTLLLDASTDELLSGLAFAWRCDRSELARQFITSKLTAYNVADELTKAAVAYAKKPIPGESNGSTDRQSAGDGESSDGEIQN